MKLEVQHLQKSFAAKHVLTDMSFTAESGTALGLLGRNGAGKTTTIRILLDVFKADGGQILLDGQPIQRDRIKIGYLPEERGLYPKKKILEQLIYFAQLKGLSSKEAKQKSLEWLEKLELSDYANKRLDTLSKGNQQKVSLITALIHDPDIVILDEPFSGLDPVNAMILESVIQEEIEKDKIVLFSGHQMNYIEEFCENIAILNNGVIVLEGKLSAIKHSYPRNHLSIQSSQSDTILANYPNAQRDNDAILFTLEKEEDKKAIMAELTQQYDIDTIRVVEPTLADIFVDYTKERDAQ